MHLRFWFLHGRFLECKELRYVRHEPPTPFCWVLDGEVLCSLDTDISKDIHRRFSQNNFKTQLSVTCHFKILADKQTDVIFVRRKHPELILYPISMLQVFVLETTFICIYMFTKNSFRRVKYLSRSVPRIFSCFIQTL